MGSFYALDSVTRKTITDGQEMVVQFMLPAFGSSMSKDPYIVQMFVDSFLKVAKEKGLDEALKSYSEATKTWGDSDGCGVKGMYVSNEGAYSDWVPVGPAIFGNYDDYGNIAPSDSEENKKRIEILESLFFGVPFESIMEAATDDRWFTYGFREGDDMWKVEGLNKDLPEPALMLFKRLCVTYMHAETYRTLSSPDFSGESRDGIMKDKYNIKWRNEHIERARKALPELIKAMRSEYLEVPEKERTQEEIESLVAEKYKNHTIFLNAAQSIPLFNSLEREMSLIYQACIVREVEPDEIDSLMPWFFETLHFMYNLGGMCMKLERSQYGSQQVNWFGWERLEKAMEQVLRPEMNDMFEDDPDDLVDEV